MKWQNSFWKSWKARGATHFWDLMYLMGFKDEGGTDTPLDWKIVFLGL